MRRWPWQKNRRDAKDDSQKEYRKEFNIEDKYLIKYVSDKYIIYIDFENDIDWLDCRERNILWTPDENRDFEVALAKLDKAQTLPCQNLDEKTVISFKRMLGTGYILIFEKNFNQIDNIINEAEEYLKQRNMENARSLYLTSSGIIAVLVVLIEIVFLLTISSENQKCWISGAIMGVLGAYVSIWMRSGNLTITGLASKSLHYLESLSRLFVGAIFAIVAILAMECGVIFSNIPIELKLYAYSLCGFVAGFSERLIPSLMEHFVKENTKNNE